MSELKRQSCSNLSESDSSLSVDETQHLIKKLVPQWQLDDSKISISHSYRFKNYYQTIAFVNTVAQIAHQQDHHPELLITYNQCTITYSTHSVNGLSLNDFICAAKINAAQIL